jgi:hypothetical protein
MVEMEVLRPHEEVIEDVVAKLAEAIRRDGVVRDPLIVDQEDHIVLDGMHRFSALKRLNCRFAPCCLLDYMSPQITVGSWFRIFNVENASSVAEQVLSSLKLDYKVSQTSMTDPAFDPATIIVTKEGDAFTLSHSVGGLEQCRTAAKIEALLVKRGLKVTYLSESLALQWLTSGHANFVIALPVFSKGMIRKFGSEGLLLPHKVTRHIIPSRPMEIDVPLELLTARNISVREADERLDELLQRRKIDRRPPGSVIDGRRYDEELIVFS